MDLSTKETVLAVIGSGGLIGGLVALFTLFSGRIDAYRARRRERGTDTATERNRMIDDLWKMIDEERKETEQLRKEIEELERDDKLSRPRVKRLYRTIYLIRLKLDAVISLVAGDEVLQTAWSECRKLCDDLEDILSTSDIHVSETP